MVNPVDKFNLSQKLISETVFQINKDFGTLFAQPLKLTGARTPYSELFDEILPIIDKLLGENKSHLMQLLYRIDFPEKFIRNIPTQRADAAAYLTNGILERELQKVVIRHNLGTGEQKDVPRLDK
jgi:hypothetical protein